MTTSSPTKKWRDAFVIELRLRGADGKQIGDELAQVASHCRDAGAGVEEAFGEPVAYARSVVIADGGSPALSAKEGRSLVLRTLAQAVGLMALLAVVPALGNGGQVTFTAVEVALALVLVLLLVLLVTKAEAALRLVAHRSLVVVIVSAVVLLVLLWFVALFVVPFLMVIIFTVPVVPTALVGALLLLAPSVIGSPLGDDAIVEPLTDAPPPPARSWSTIVQRWWVPAAGLVMCVLVWLVS